jgi:transcriptional regulator of arginine metabolism
VHSQAELAEALRRAGVAATQVTLSRDLKKLGLVKTAAGYAVLGAAERRPQVEAVPAWAHVVREFVRDLRAAQNLLVVKTEPGAAPTVAAALDTARWTELAGSLAGDDTVLLVCENVRRRMQIEQRMRSLVGAVKVG